ncbi:MAG: sigma-70 family RNA polymerase sigma factor [Candidatus Aminicenantes bacterium]|nr:sigma-70 family RNA polymerase sigma factor [Candidatus Aminicenantes bacterium]
MKQKGSNNNEFEALIEKLYLVIQTSVQSFHPQKLGIDPEDLAQEIRIKLWKIFESDKKILNYSSYIKRVINSIIIDQIRTSRRFEKIIDLEKRRNVQDQGISNVPIRIRQDVILAVNSLIESRRKVVRWFLFGLSVSEIAKILNIDEAKANNLLYRGIKDLRNILESKGVKYED